MNAEVVKKWLIAEIKDAAGDNDTISGTPRVRNAAINDLPSDEGIYIGLNGLGIDNRRISGNQEVRIVIVRNSEQAVLTNMNELSDLLVSTPGEAKSWRVDPSTESLRLYDIALVSGSPPEASGPNNPVWRSVLIYNVRGRDTRRET